MFIVGGRGRWWSGGDTAMLGFGGRPETWGLPSWGVRGSLPRVAFLGATTGF